MQHKKVKLSAVLLLGLCLTGLHAQENIPASGGEASGSGGSLSYSVGQIVYSVNSGTNGTVGQGVQQAFEISAVTGIEEKLGISLTLSVYPNPATDYLTLRVENFDSENLSYKLLDIKGKLLVNKEITGNETNIDMRRLIPGTYFLKIVVQTGHAVSIREIKTFKIIKN